MILAVPLPPAPAQVVTGVLAAVAAALVAAVATFLGRRSHNWLHYVSAAGGLLLLAGIVGQRTVADGSRLGPWDTGIPLPIIGVHIDPVAAAGIVIVLLGVTLTLLFERVVDEDDAPRALVHRPLEDDDAV
jgi:hypothetical protein